MEHPTCTSSPTTQHSTAKRPQSAPLGPVAARDALASVSPLLTCVRLDRVVACSVAGALFRSAERFYLWVNTTVITVVKGALTDQPTDRRTHRGYGSTLSSSPPPSYTTPDFAVHTPAALTTDSRAPFLGVQDREPLYTARLQPSFAAAPPPQVHPTTRLSRL
jgi:hypothetical protein